LSPLVCRFGHKLHASNSRLVRHSKTGKTWRRCLICHAARQRALRKTRCALSRNAQTCPVV
jgi:hypothetical protein